MEMQHLENLISASIKRIQEDKIDVYSYALYFDHESKRRLSICIDTKDNSRRVVNQSNQFTARYFKKYLEEEDFESLKTFSSNSGRSYSLGDFNYRNVTSFEHQEALDFSDLYILRAIKTITSSQDEITRFSLNPEEVLFSCSTKDDEYGVSWFRLTTNA
ncbi:MAG TPA: hypothetical protein VHY09_10380 [Candidatus Methylacidiphilales bacterium]|jgi:hypothetical protein|nr:hypothetical protein [Candidatus Methylacidiphilales bacterium]